MADTLRLEAESGVAWLVLDRPERRNAISLEMWSALPKLLDEVERDSDVKVLVLRGCDDRAFSAGADVGEFETLLASSAGTEAYDLAADAAEDALATLTKPTIAMIQGACIGAGCGLAIACDLRFADTSGVFAITAANLGVVYNFQATKRLVDLVGPAGAKYVLFSGRQIDAVRASEIGLVDAVFAPEQLESATTEFAQTIATRAQFSVRSTKRIVRLVTEGQATESGETRRLRAAGFDTDDYREGVRAFLEKRPPTFRYS